MENYASTHLFNTMVEIPKILKANKYLLTSFALEFQLSTSEKYYLNHKQLEKVLFNYF